MSDSSERVNPTISAEEGSKTGTGGKCAAQGLVELVEEHAQEDAEEENLAKEDHGDEQEDEGPTASTHAGVHDGIPVLACRLLLFF